MSGTTGQICQQSGIYYCSSHPQNRISLSKGERFPPCGHSGGHGATWILAVKA